MQTRKSLPYIAAAVSAVAWGFSFVFTKAALARMEMFQLLGCRFLMAAALMTLLAVTGLAKIRLTGRKLLRMLPAALLQPVLYFTLETFGVSLTTAAECGIVVALGPIFITLFSVLLLRERLSAMKWASIGVCVAGVAVLALAQGGGGGGGRLLGIAALLGAMAAAGLYTALSRKLSAECSPMEITFMMMAAGAVGFNIVGLTAHRGGVVSYLNGFLDLDAMLGVAYLAVVCSVVAFFCLNFAVSRLEASVVGTFINLAPLISVLAGVVIAGDSLSLLQMAGGALILAGVWGAARARAQGAAGGDGNGLPPSHKSSIISITKKRRETL